MAAEPMGNGRTWDWSAEIMPPRFQNPVETGGYADTVENSGNSAENLTGPAAGRNWPVRTCPGCGNAQSGWLTPQPPADWTENGGSMETIGQDIENNLPPGEIGAPDSLEEVFQGSMKALLLRNIGNYVVATFLIGTQGTVSWEGILYDVGNDYLAIYQTGRDQYIVSDLYSLKYVEFYDAHRRQRGLSGVQNG